MRTTCTEHADCALLDATDANSKRQERVHASRESDNAYRISRPPAIVRSCALGDLVKVSPMEDHLVIDSVIASGSMQVLWLEEREERVLQPILKTLPALGAVVSRLGNSVNITFLAADAQAILERIMPLIETGVVLWKR